LGPADFGGHVGGSADPHDRRYRGWRWRGRRARDAVLFAVGGLGTLDILPLRLVDIALASGSVMPPPNEYPKHIDIAILAGLISVAPLGAQNMPAALLGSFEGPVQIRASGSDPEPATVGQRLEVGDEILPGAGGRVILVTRTGTAQVVTQNTVIEDAPPASSSSVMARTISVLAQAATFTLCL